MSLGPEGLIIPSQADLEAQLAADHRADISPTIDVSPSSPDGMRITIVARQNAIAYELLEAIYAAIDRDAAEGDALDRLNAITGTEREEATPSRVTCECDLDAGTYGIGVLVAHVVGFPERRFVNAEAVTSVGGANDVVFEGETAGPLAAPAGTLTERASPVSGWNSVTNDADAVEGNDIEADPAFRLRGEAEVQAPGSASVNGIAARVLRDVTETEVCYVIENDTDTTVDTVGPHGIEVVVHGPTSPTADDDQAVAEAIFEAKSAGIKTYGSTTETVVDDAGFSHTVKFTRPTEQATDVAITLVKDAQTYAGDDAVETAIAAISPLLPGRDLAWAAVVVAAMSVPGVLRITTVQLDALGAFTNKTITPRQYASISSGDVTVTSSSGTP